MGFGAKLMHAWNAFVDQDEPNRQQGFDLGASYGGRPDRARYTMSNERSIVSSIYTRLSIDVAAMSIRHVRLDKDDRYLEEMDSELNNCLRVQANKDQGARQFRQDVAMRLFDRGAIAIVPVDTTLSPELTGGYDILSLRVGEVTQWMPNHVRVMLYNDKTGRMEEITLEKKFVAIVENPFYAAMNETNSTLQRLIRKLNLLDAIDEQSGSGKLDMIIQLPYVVKSEARRQQAEQRRKDIEFQLRGSQYGIAYADGTEKITQLNRPAENNLLKQVEFLVGMLYSQLGLTEEIMNGTADEKTMLNYINRTLEPVLDAITESMAMTFLTKTARTQKQSIKYYRDPFKLVPLSNIAEIADKFTRNEIASSNEIRQAIGWRPSSDPKADELRNSNLYGPDGTAAPTVVAEPVVAEDSAAIVSDAFTSVEGELESIISGLEGDLSGG